MFININGIRYNVDNINWYHKISVRDEDGKYLYTVVLFHNDITGGNEVLETYDETEADMLLLRLDQTLGTKNVQATFRK